MLFCVIFMLSVLFIYLYFIFMYIDLFIFILFLFYFAFFGCRKTSKICYFVFFLCYLYYFILLLDIFLLLIFLFRPIQDALLHFIIFIYVFFVTFFGCRKMCFTSVVWTC